MNDFFRIRYFILREGCWCLLTIRCGWGRVSVSSDDLIHHPDKLNGTKLGNRAWARRLNPVSRDAPEFISGSLTLYLDRSRAGLVGRAEDVGSARIRSRPKLRKLVFIVPAAIQ